ncbi:MAG: hypothetical protein KAJ29_03760 [Alphaproteobacteria bacterium]|nr:hypothetical protein [Alphaproteobacteria bacterium]
MIPSGNISTALYAKLIGNQAYLAIAQGNLFANLELISKNKRMHTFLAFNGQKKDGVSHNSGAKRYYTWKDTIIDCRQAPGLIDSEGLEAWGETVSESRKFKRFKEKLEKKLSGHITVELFHKTLRGEDNMRYNIQLETKVEDFDSIRVGICLKAEDDEAFKIGLDALKSSENPNQMKAHPLEKDLEV